MRSPRGQIKADIEERKELIAWLMKSVLQLPLEELHFVAAVAAVRHARKHLSPEDLRTLVELPFPREEEKNEG